MEQGVMIMFDDSSDLFRMLAVDVVMFAVDVVMFVVKMAPYGQP